MFNLEFTDYWRIIRDLVHSELARTPGIGSRLGSRHEIDTIDLGADGLDADSLTRVQLSTAAATLFNTFDVGLEDLFLAKRQVSDWVTVLQRAHKAGARDLSFSTSGSTGERKHFRHAEQTLWHEAQSWVTHLAGVKRVVVMCPTHHIYGFIWGVLIPKVLNVPFIEVDHLEASRWLPGDLIVGVPAQWEWLANKFVRNTVPQQVIGVSSTSPMPVLTRKSLMEYGPNKFLEIYGSTETAGVGYRQIQDEHYRLIDCRKKQLDQVVMCALDLDRTTTSHALKLQDQLNWINDTEFELGVRADGIVQVGGHNVSPQWVSQQMSLHEAVLESSVRLDRNAHPLRLKAFVVLKKEQESEKFESWLKKTLPHYAMPQRIDYGNTLPRNGMGKLSDWA